MQTFFRSNFDYQQYILTVCVCVRRKEVEGFMKYLINNFLKLLIILERAAINFSITVFACWVIDFIFLASSRINEWKKIYLKLKQHRKLFIQKKIKFKSHEISCEFHLNIISKLLIVKVYRFTCISHKYILSHIPFLMSVLSAVYIVLLFLLQINPITAFSTSCVSHVCVCVCADLYISCM